MLKRSYRTMPAVLALSVLCSGIPVHAQESEQERFDAFLMEQFVETMESDYMSMHFSVEDYTAYGIEKPELTLGDNSWESFEEAVAANTEVLNQLESFDYDALSETGKDDYLVLKEYLEESIELNSYPLLYGYFEPYTGIQTTIPTNFTEFIFRNEEDVKDYLVVLDSVDEYMNDALEVTAKQVEQGYFMTDEMLDTTLEDLNAFVEKTEDNELIISFEDAMESADFLSEEEKNDYEQQNRDIVLNTIIPSYQKAISVLETYRGSRSFEGGLCNYENGGEDYYRALVRFKTNTTMSVEEQIDMLKGVLNDLIDELIVLYQFDYDVEEEYKEEVVGFDAPDEILTYLQNHLTDYPQGPSVSYQYSYLDPSIANDATLAYYMLPTIDNITDNVIRINGENVTDVNSLYETLAHEGFPGHLYQYTYYMSTNPSPIRRVTSMIGYMEGWGMYAEVNAWEDSGLSESVAKMHILETEIGYIEDAWIDLGVNGLGWTVDDVSEQLESIYLSGDYAQTLYDFVITRPGMILPYGVGLACFLNLKQNAAEALGSDFNLKEFNTILLEGDRSLDMVEEDVNAWIKEKGGTADSSETVTSEAGTTINPYYIGAGVTVALGVVCFVLAYKKRKKDPIA